jgi:hypothetical protein
MTFDTKLTQAMSPQTTQEIDAMFKVFNANVVRSFIHVTTFTKLDAIVPW